MILRRAYINHTYTRRSTYTQYIVVDMLVRILCYSNSFQDNLENMCTDIFMPIDRPPPPPMVGHLHCRYCNRYGKSNVLLPGKEVHSAQKIWILTTNFQELSAFA